jgi:hypothetical protein
LFQPAAGRKFGLQLEKILKTGGYMKRVYWNFEKAIFPFKRKLIKVSITLVLLITWFLCIPKAFGQSGKLEGYVKDRVTTEGVLNAQLILIQNGVPKARVVPDSVGYFTFTPLDPGNYTMKISAMGYAPIIYTDIEVGNKTRTLPDILMVQTGLNDSDIVVHAPTFDPNGGVKEKEIDKKTLDKMPVKNIDAVVGIQEAVQTYGQGRIAIKGDPYGILYCLNGIPVGRSSPNIPFTSIETMEMITGGIPLDYGDLTAGVINLTTRNPSDKFTASIEGLSSQFLDPFGYNLIEGTITGPLLKKKGKSIIGYALSGSYNYMKVSNPPPLDLFRVKPEILSNLKNNPVGISPFGSGYISNASLITMKDMRKTRVEENTASQSYSFVGKLSFQPSEGLNILLGGSLDHSSRNLDYTPFALFNANNNPLLTDNNYRTFARARQTFKSKESDLVKYIFYTVELSYTNHNQVLEDSRLQDNYFDYGYLGIFNRQFTPSYFYETHNVNGKPQTGYYEKVPTETRVTFQPGGVNTDAENYTKQAFDLHGGSFNSFTDLQSKGALVNGQSPSLVYSLWAAPGTLFNQYRKSQDEQYNITASGCATIKNHNLKFGFEYQENVSRSYSVGGNFGTDIQGLWTRARQLLNSHLTQFDTLHPQPVYSNGNFTDTINYRWQAVEGAQSTFDKNFRDYLINKGARDENGKLIDQQSIINLDRYKPYDLKLSYFSPDELLSSGHSYVNAYGYDYQGNKLSGKPTVNDFLDPMKRSEGAYHPIYASGYIQDRFEYKKIKISVGLRVDRFDANQKVLVDPYSLFPIRTVKEVRSLDGSPVSHPGNIGQDYYVYVDDIKNPTKITGYRNGSTWYNSNGAEITDPKQVAQLSRTGTITPYLENPDQKTITASSFRDYTPQLNFMPRVSFSFPINDRAGFYANYDVLTKRPTNNFGALDYYYFIDTRSTSTLPNPDLKPEKRTNYEMGFRQMITGSSYMSLNAYYGEIRDLVQLARYNYAYPVTYTSYSNIDFGTVKGISAGYDFVRPDTISSGLTISANYTLQFADATGSGSTSAAGLLSAGFPNLRTIYPLDFDTRHQLNCMLDYRFGNSVFYTGPVSAKGKKWLADAGINLLLTAKSGNPYTAQANITSTQEIGVENRSTMVGTINGSRMPWQFRADLKMDKNFILKGKTIVNLYIQVQNLLDARNVVAVYKFTGQPNQDGYLASPSGKSEAGRSASQQAFIDQYNIKLNDPANYISPRLVRIGASVNF